MHKKNCLIIQFCVHNCYGRHIGTFQPFLNRAVVPDMWRLHFYCRLLVYVTSEIRATSFWACPGLLGQHAHCFFCGCLQASKRNLRLLTCVHQVLLEVPSVVEFSDKLWKYINSKYKLWLSLFYGIDSSHCPASCILLDLVFHCSIYN